MPLKRRDGELILDWLEEIGLIWVNNTYQVREQVPHENINRFKLYQQAMMIVGISLWTGTALYIPCDDLSFPEDDELGWYKKDSGGKELLITVSIFVGKKRGLAAIIKEYHTYITDEMQLLPVFYWNYKHSFSDLQDLRNFLNTIKSFLPQK